MPRDTREPQSYGSDRDWVTGRTGQQVNDPKSTPPPEHREFYDDRRESETTAPHQGGHASDVQRADQADPVGRPSSDESPERGESPVQKVTAQPGGAKRDSFFKKRDYE